VDFALAGRSRPTPAAFVTTVGRTSVLAIALAGLTVGFFLWYGFAMRAPEGSALLDITLPLALLAGLSGVSAAWFLYSRYFARRSHVDEIVALRYDAAAWTPAVLLWGVLLAPSGGHGSGRAVGVALAALVLAKIVVAARFNRTVRDVGITFIVTRLPLIAIAEIAAVAIGQRPGTHYAASTNPLLAVWGRWDAEHYIGIARNGYSGTEPAFFPLFPLLIRIVGAFTGSKLIAGLLIANACSFLGLLYLYKLIEHEYNRHVAQRATFYIAIFPTAIFFSAVYSESLFVFLTVATFYYLRERRWLTAGAFGFFAAMSRSEGILLAAPFALEWLIAAREGGRTFFRYVIDDVVKPFIGLALVPAGLACYMAFLWVISGDPLLFSHVQKHWGRSFGPPWVSFQHSFYIIGHLHGVAVSTEVQELAFTLLMLVMLVLGVRRLRPSYTLYMALSIAVPLCTSSLMSMPRFALVLFPMFVLFGLWGAKNAWNNAYVAFSLPLLGLFTVLFADWYWVA
jgi:hypothetical protein